LDKLERLLKSKRRQKKEEATRREDTERLGFPTYTLESSVDNLPVPISSS
jgi:hypothetical protein